MWLHRQLQTSTLTFIKNKEKITEPSIVIKLKVWSEPFLVLLFLGDFYFIYFYLYIFSYVFLFKQLYAMLGGIEKIEI